ncbi:UVI-1 protein [Plectosphaerella plurivora]|uniref:UVI-1 protein n=1 Tax=Plectosphaerella plurivora TaxID=936078 RepID=A0A9P9A7D8_9PEZI|nr:UVI-1 protein [Plectosphaerella plurivora]
MRFSILNSAVAALAVCSTALGQMTPSQVVDNIKSLTTKSQALQAPAQSISIINGPLIVVGLGPFPPLILGFTDIVTTATTAIAQMQSMPPVAAGAPSDLIFDAFREFVRVHQVLLNILIGKAGLFTVVPLIGAPVAAVLRQIESIVDTVAFKLIDNVQSRADDLRREAGSLGSTITIAIDQFEGLNL